MKVMITYLDARLFHQERSALIFFIDLLLSEAILLIHLLTFVFVACIGAHATSEKLDFHVML